MYKSELHFVNAVIKFLTTNENNALSLNHHKKHLFREFNHNNGWVDLLGVNNENEKIIAIEAKLYDWKTALWQAYRSSSYAHYIYVLMPEYSIGNINEKYLNEFEKFGIGLCTYYRSNFKILISAKENQPFFKSLTESAYKSLCITPKNQGLAA